MTSKPFCFVLMPSNNTDELYQVIQEVCEGLEVHCERVEKKDLNPSTHIIDSILKEIRTADLIIYDATGKSANVFFEVGFATALGKPMIRLAKNEGEIPYDTRTHQHLLHNGCPLTLREQLEPKLEQLVQRLNTAPNLGEPRIELFEKGRELQPKDQIHHAIVNLPGPRIKLGPRIDLLLFNKSSFSFQDGEMKIAIKAPHLSFVQHHDDTIQAHASPEDAQGIATIENLGGFIVGQSKGLSIGLGLQPTIPLQELLPTLAITIQLLTPFGMREWELTFESAGS